MLQFFLLAAFQWSTPGLFAISFSALFLDGVGELNWNNGFIEGEQVNLQFAACIRHLFRVGDERFAKHRTFRYVPLNVCGTRHLNADPTKAKEELMVHSTLVAQDQLDLTSNNTNNKWNGSWLHIK